MWFLFAFTALLPRPPVGAVYARRLHLPLVGAQRICVRVDSEEEGTLCLRGALTLDDRVGFVDGSFVLGDATRALLRRTRTALVGATYDPETDTATVTVQPPLPMPLDIRLERE